MVPPRDRDREGRPKSARPRDAMGRPLARDATPEISEEELPPDPDALLAIGVEHFNAGSYFLAHEAWETAWHPAPESERDFWQGITQVAVGFTHHQRGNTTGAVSLLRRGASRLSAYEPVFRGFPVAVVAAAAIGTADAIEAGGAAATIEPPMIRLANRA